MIQKEANHVDVTSTRCMHEGGFPVGILVMLTHDHRIHRRPQLYSEYGYSGCIPAHLPVPQYARSVPRGPLAA